MIGVWCLSGLQVTWCQVSVWSLCVCLVLCVGGGGLGCCVYGVCVMCVVCGVWCLVFGVCVCVVVSVFGDWSVVWLVYVCLVCGECGCALWLGVVVVVVSGGGGVCEQVIG